MSFFYRIKGSGIRCFVMDAAVIGVSFFLSSLLNALSSSNGMYPYDSAACIASAWAIILPVYYFSGLYRILWHYSNVRDIYRLLIITLACFPVILVVHSVFLIRCPAAISINAMIMICVGMVFYRVLFRDLFARFVQPDEEKEVLDPWGIPHRGEDKRILIIGAGEAGRMILAEYIKRGIEKSIIGFLDDNPHKIGRTLSGKPVFSSIDRASSVIRAERISEVIVAMPSVDSQSLKNIVLRIKRDNQGIVIKLLPHFTRVFESLLSPSLRSVGIGDLLGREEFAIDVDAIRQHFSGKTILVTGAGGSIGSEICKQLLKFDIKGLVALGKGEHSIYTLARDLNEHLFLMEKGTEVYYRIADVRNPLMLEKIFSEFKPDIVIHAAAHKHVPLMEFNEIESLVNNVWGSRNVFDACLGHGVSQCILISTDKAVRPVNIMGATKRLAELVARYYYEEMGLKVSAVRFGNVIGSRGSVIPLFQDQIEKGGPVTVTHPDITRYFMSIPEASILVINASAYGHGGEIFVLDMGEQYRVADIARQLIRLYGLEPDRDIRIEYNGLRPGEKLYEELFYEKEQLITTCNQRIFILGNGGSDNAKAGLREFLDSRLEDLYRLTPEEIRILLRRQVPDYRYDGLPDEKGTNRIVS